MLKRCTIRPSYFTINHNHRFKQYANDIFTIINEDPLTISNGPLTLQCTPQDITRLAQEKEITYKQPTLKNSLSWYLTNGRRCVIINTYSAKQEDIPAPKNRKREKWRFVKLLALKAICHKPTHLFTLSVNFRCRYQMFKEGNSILIIYKPKGLF